MKNILDYIYYRIAKFYKNTFGIEDAPGYLLIHSCYSWGLLVLVTTLISYVLAIETVVLWEFGIKTNTVLIIGSVSTSVSEVCRLQGCGAKLDKYFHFNHWL